MNVLMRVIVRFKVFASNRRDQQSQLAIDEAQIAKCGGGVRSRLDAVRRKTRRRYDM